MDDAGLKQLLEQVRGLIDQPEPRAPGQAALQHHLLVEQVRKLCQAADELLRDNQVLERRLSRTPGPNPSQLELLEQWARKHGIDLPAARSHTPAQSPES